MKTTGVVVTFDDKEYSEEETIFLYQRFFEVLGKLQELMCLKTMVKGYLRELKKKPMRTRNYKSHLQQQF